MTGYHQHAEQSVNLARPTSSQTVGTKAGAAHLAVGELRTRCRDHAVSVEVSPPPELDAISEYR